MTKFLFTIAVLSILFISCKEETLFEPLSGAEINGEKLWERINVEGDYSAYSFWPGHEGINPGQAPHGVNHRIYINNSLKAALPIANSTAPFGTIIVKESMNSDEVLQNITVMAKVEGFNPEGGNWFWAAFSPDGEVKAEGTPKGCISCHEGMKSNDYIIVRPLALAIE